MKYLREATKRLPKIRDEITEIAESVATASDCRPALQAAMYAAKWALTTACDLLFPEEK